MHKHIEKIVDVGTNGNCGYRVESALLGNGEEQHILVRKKLISELTSHSELYTCPYVTKDKFNKIHHVLAPSVTVHAPVEKWMCFPKMGHLIANAYNVVCVDLTRYDFSETFFPLQAPAPIDPSEHLVCVGYLRSCHFVQVYLKLGCLLLATSVEKEAETLSVHFFWRE